MLPVLRAYFKAGAYPHVPSGGTGRLSTFHRDSGIFQKEPRVLHSGGFQTMELGPENTESYQFLKHCLQRFTALRRFSLNFCFLVGETYGLFASPSDE